MIKGVWFGIVEAAHVIMALSDGKNNSKWLKPHSCMLRGVLFMTNRIVFCNRESLKIVPINLRKKIIQTLKLMLFSDGCMSTIISDNNRQNILILEPVGKRLQEGLGSCQQQ